MPLYPIVLRICALSSEHDAFQSYRPVMEHLLPFQGVKNEIRLPRAVRVLWHKCLSEDK